MFTFSVNTILYKLIHIFSQTLSIKCLLIQQLQMMQKYAAASAASLSYNVPPPPPPPVLPPPTYGPPVLPAALPPPPPDPVPVPTDPVSMQLAFKAQEMAGRAVEDKLSFGFRSMPADGTINKVELI